jgi:hypothetical protein
VGSGTLSLTLREVHRLIVLENRVLRGIFGPKRYEIIGGWKELHNEDLHKWYSSLCIIRSMSRRIRLTRYVACMGSKGMLIEFWRESQKERDHLEDQDIGGLMILK